MKVKLGELKDSIQALNRLAQIPFSAKLSYRLMRTTKDANREFQTFHNFHIELILKHGGIQTDQGVVVPPERMPEFSPEYKDLAEQEVEVWGDQLLIEDFFGAESWRCTACNQTMQKTDPEISASDLMLLSWLFKEPEGLETGELPADSTENAEAIPVN
jgi:hypothetical protein